MLTNADAGERDRLSSLDRYDVLDTPQEEAFDRVTRLTRRFFDVPIATITFIDGHRQWFKSRQGLAACETARAPALCNVAITEARPLVVPDTLEDERFRRNPLVVGEPHIRFYAGAPLSTPEGHTIGTLCAIDTKPRTFAAPEVEVLTDLARIVMSELELRTLATTDGLTGVLSRRAFREEGGRALALAVRHRLELSCITFDLDCFKSINDVHGHPVGDAVLVESTAVCRSLLRTSDVIGRLGGEEFAILLPHTGRAAAMEVAEKLRAEMERRRVTGSSTSVAFSASFGVAAFDRSAPDIETLLHRADTALYAAKAEGRNRCVAWQRLEPAQAGLRRRVLKAGKIAFNGGRSIIDCTVRSLSDTGAGLDVVSSAGVPEGFKLRIDADDFSRTCRVITHRERHLDVEFV